LEYPRPPELHPGDCTVFLQDCPSIILLRWLIFHSPFQGHPISSLRCSAERLTPVRESYGLVWIFPFLNVLQSYSTRFCVGQPLFSLFPPFPAYLVFPGFFFLPFTVELICGTPFFPPTARDLFLLSRVNCPVTVTHSSPQPRGFRLLCFFSRYPVVVMHLLPKHIDVFWASP